MDFTIQGGTLFLNRENKKCGFHVKVKKVPELIGPIALILGKYSLHMVHMTKSPLERAETCEIFIVADFAGETVDLENVTDKIRALDDVLEVKAVRPTHGFLLDEKLFPLRVGNVKVACFSPVALQALFIGLKDSFGSGASTILYVFGRKVAEAATKAFFGEGKTEVRKVLEAIKLLCQGHGWARFEILSLNENYATVKLLECFEGETIREKASGEHMNCYYIKGLIEGMLEKAIMNRFEANEVECVGHGNSACIFKIKRLR